VSQSLGEYASDLSTLQLEVAPDIDTDSLRTMAENISVDSVSDAQPAKATEQARLRKERREAKIKAGGSARLNKITGLGGGVPKGDLTYLLVHQAVIVTILNRCNTTRFQQQSTTASAR
jgi:hypothetical protein